MRQDWKRDLLNESVKNDEDFQNELEEKWKLGLFGEEYNQEGVVSRRGLEPSTPEVKSKSGSPSPLFSKVYPNHLEEMREDKILLVKQKVHTKN